MLSSEWGQLGERGLRARALRRWAAGGCQSTLLLSGSSGREIWAGWGASTTTALTSLFVAKLLIFAAWEVKNNIGVIFAFILI